MPAATHIPEILEEHFEELAFLLHLRAVQVASGKMLFRQFIDLDDRVQGHVDGLCAVPGPAIDMANVFLGGDEPLSLRAAAYTLLRLDPGGSSEALFLKMANPAAAAPIFDALLLVRSSDMAARLKKQSTDSAQPVLAAAAMEVLASSSDVNGQALGTLLAHTVPAVRAAAWRAAQRLTEPRSAPQYKAGCGDADPLVRDAALLAAAWAGQGCVLDFCRPFLKKLLPENLVTLRLWAILAPPAEAAAAAPELAKAMALGPARFDLLAATGLPAMVPHLLLAMRGDTETAAAAAEAFARLTNYLPPSKGTATVAPAGKKLGEFEKAFLPEVQVPDADAAAKYWAGIEGQLGTAARIARGMVTDPFPSADALLDLDNAARDATLLRHIALPELKKYASKSARWAFPQR